MGPSCLHENDFFRALLLLVATAITSFASELEAIPTEAAQQQALTLIKEVYGPEWEQARTPEQKAALATKLLAKSREATDGANRFVLLRIAKETAVQAGDVHIALRAVDQAANQFQIDTPDARVNTFLAAAEFASNPAAKKAIAERARPFIEQAVEEDDFELAKRLYEAAVAAARSADEWELTKQIVARNKKIEEVAAAYAEIQDALATLKDKPVDPEANLAVGKYHCFVKGNWDRGLPMLALGSDEKLKKLAVKELRGVPDTKGRVAVGDGWWEVAEKESDATKRHPQRRATYWYRRALPWLAGLMKDRVQTRLDLANGNADAKKQTPTPAVTRQELARVRQELARQKRKRLLETTLRKMLTSQAWARIKVNPPGVRFVFYSNGRCVGPIGDGKTSIYTRWEVKGDTLILYTTDGRVNRRYKYNATRERFIGEESYFRKTM